MMDTGVPIKRPVAGIAMGLMKEGDDVAILSDIQGLEDFLGDMDFKVAGTENGITALQMDIKIKGISDELLEKALDQADHGYKYILGIMNETISAPREELSPNAPRMIKLQIEVDKIRDVIGPGGRMINKIIAETGVNIDIEPDGRVFIAAVDPEMGKKALTMIENLVKDVEAGEIYIATHPDMNCPTADGYMPDTGSMIELLAASTGRRPLVMGKPMTATVDYITALLGCERNELAFVGDRLATDIAIGADHGIPSALVFTGVTSPSVYETSAIRADVAVLRLADLCEYL